MTRIQQLTELVTKYGETTIHAIRSIDRFGNDVVAALPAFLGDGAEVSGVPPDGDWQPEVAYESERFSFFKRDLITLDPVRMGVAVRIPYRANIGWVWVKAVVEFEMQNGNLFVTVEHRPRRQIADVNDPKQVDAVCGDIFDHLLSVFQDPVALATGAKQMKIGF